MTNPAKAARTGVGDSTWEREIAAGYAAVSASSS